MNTMQGKVGRGWGALQGATPEWELPNQGCALFTDPQWYRAKRRHPRAAVGAEAVLLVLVAAAAEVTAAAAA